MRTRSRLAAAAEHARGPPAVAANACRSSSVCAGSSPSPARPPVETLAVSAAPDRRGRRAGGRRAARSRSSARRRRRWSVRSCRASTQKPGGAAIITERPATVTRGRGSTAADRRRVAGGERKRRGERRPAQRLRGPHRRAARPRAPGWVTAPSRVGPTELGVLPERARRRRSSGAARPRPRGAPRARRRTASTLISPRIASSVIMSPSRSSAIGPPSAASGPDMADAEAAGGAGEAAVGDQRHLLAHALAGERRGRRQHLAHAGAADRALVADDDDVALVVGALLHRGEGVLLALEDPRRAGEDLLGLAHAGDLHDRALGREVALEPDDAAGRRDRRVDRDRSPGRRPRRGCRRAPRRCVRPLAVMQSSCSRPARRSSFSTTGTPPTS